MAGFCLRAHPLQNTQRKTHPPSARSVQDCAWSSFSHLKIPFFENYRRVQHNDPGGLACSQLQSGFRLLPGVCALGPYYHTVIAASWLGAWDHCQLLQLVVQGLHLVHGATHPHWHTSVPACCPCLTPEEEKVWVSAFPLFKFPSPKFCVFQKGQTSPANSIG